MRKATLPNNFSEFIEQGCGRCSLTNTPACKVHTWHSQLLQLQTILLNTPLQETIKWGFPCYTIEGKNVVMLGVFSKYLTISFFKGVHLTNTHQLLELPGENTKEGRIIKITNDTNIPLIKSTLQALVKEAIEVEKNKDLVQKPITKKEPIPAELLEAFAKLSALEQAFNKLTPGKQRGYLLHFNSSKNAETRSKRIANCTPKILAGNGFHDK